MEFTVSIITEKELELGPQAHSLPYLILAYYHLQPLTDPKKELEIHRQFFQGRDVKSRIYLAFEGINGTLSAPVEEAYAYMKWLSSRPEFAGIQFKVHEWTSHVLARLDIKVRKELVAFGKKISLENGGKRVEPSEWRKMLEEEQDKVLIDVRNDYEWELGHFEGAEMPKCITFKDFKQYASDLKKRIGSKKTKVMMYCTGGIRCEFYSAFLKQEGIDNVFQLDGGIINYGIEEKSNHWKGKLFVFDDRLTVPLSEEKSEVIGKCHYCVTPIEVYYNCANLDCNTLFLCCPECLETKKGCCKDACMHAERVRPFKLAHTPFRRWHYYRDTE